jgi:hypothetical protein
MIHLHQGARQNKGEYLCAAEINTSECKAITKKENELPQMPRRHFDRVEGLAYWRKLFVDPGIDVKC